MGGCLQKKDFPFLVICRLKQFKNHQISRKKKKEAFHYRIIADLIIASLFRTALGIDDGVR